MTGAPKEAYSTILQMRVSNLSTHMRLPPSFLMSLEKKGVEVHIVVVGILFMICWDFLGLIYFSFFLNFF